MVFRALATFEFASEGPICIRRSMVGKEWSRHVIWLSSGQSIKINILLIIEQHLVAFWPAPPALSRRRRLARHATNPKLFFKTDPSSKRSSSPCDKKHLQTRTNHWNHYLPYNPRFFQRPPIPPRSWQRLEGQRSCHDGSIKLVYRPIHAFCWFF